MEYPRWEFFGIIGGGEAEDICIKDQPGALSRPERVPVYAYYPRQGAAVWIQGRRGIVGLHLEDEIKIIIKFYDPRIIDEDGEAPVIIGKFFPDLLGRPLYAGIEEGVYDSCRSLFIFICNETVEYFVLTVFRPGLGERFQFDICDPSAKPHLFPFPYNGFVLQIVFYDLHLINGQSEDPLAADFLKPFIPDVEINLIRCRVVLYYHPGNIWLHALSRIPLTAAYNLVALNEFVGQKT